MGLVPAICPLCGAEIMADQSRDAAICPFCLEPYVVEKAIRKHMHPNGTSEAETKSTGEAVPETAKDCPVREPGAAEAELADKIVKAVLKQEGHVAGGLYTLDGGFEPEETIRAELREILDQSLLSPCDAGSGLVTLLKEYNEKYSIVDVISEGTDEAALTGEIKRRLRKEGFESCEVSAKTITMSRCEWYEVKSFFGLKSGREKKLVSKIIRALCVTCEPLPENKQEKNRQEEEA